MSTKPIPEGYDSLMLSFIVQGAAKAIDFYKELFGATEIMRMTSPDGSKIMHAELKIRNHVLMLGDESQQYGMLSPKSLNGPPPISIFLYVENVDAVFNKAIKMGAQVKMPPAEMFWGDRYAKFTDPFGHIWGVATKTKDISPEECAKAAAEWAKQHAG
jgi:uncharacterized glyoxalase superfamily protein PhnB